MEPVTIVKGGTRVIIHFLENYSLCEVVTADDLLEVGRARDAKENNRQCEHCSRPHRAIYIITQMQTRDKQALTDLL